MKILKTINTVLNRCNCHLIQIKNSKVSKDKLLINIGSGDWTCKGWKNLDYVTDWYQKSLSKHDIMHYDIRSDKLPFGDNSVDGIYCSHVIEHIENVFVQKMFEECFRTMKKEAVFRIACPDAEYLYQASKFNNEFWEWRKPWFDSGYYSKAMKPRQVDFLVREVATPKLLGYVNGINQEDYLDDFDKKEMDVFLQSLTKDLHFRKEFPGDHINNYTFSKLKEMLELAGFKTIIRSKRLSSISQEFMKAHKFDLTEPIMSLYVEAIK